MEVQHSASEAATRWSFLGERFCSFYESSEANRPHTPLTINGQVSPAPAGVITYGPFVIHAHDTRIDLLTDSADTTFLARCLAAGLRCWATGQLITHARARIMNCERVHVWHVGSKASLASLPTVVLQALATAARDAALARWAQNLSPSLGHEHALHPVAYEGVSRYLASPSFADDGSTAGLLPAAHLEATARCGSSAVRIDSHLQLGSSDLFFCPATNTCLLGSPPLASAFRPVRAGLIVADHSRALLGLLRHVARLRLSPSSEAGAPQHSRLLVLAPRRAIAGVVAALRVDAPLVLCSRHDLVLAREQLPTAPLAILARETLESPEAAEALLQQSGTWSRVVQVGWPQACAVIPPADFVLALALRCEVREMLLQNLELSLRHLARLFGLEPGEMNDTRTLTALLTYRVFNLHRSRGSAQQVHRYSYLCLSQPPATHAVGLLSSRRQYRDERALLFGALGAEHAEATFPTAHDAVSHFEAIRRLPLSDYARASLGGSPEASADRVCPVCFDDAPDAATRCGHWFCRECLRNAMQIRRGCPVCKTALQARRDVVVPQQDEEPAVAPPPPETEEPPELRRLLDLLEARARQDKVLVLACFGEVHAHLAALLRARHVNVAVWRGNSRQLLQAHATFEGWRAGALLVDGTAVDTRWVQFSNVRRLFVVTPLQASASEVCCQIRDALDCCQAAHIDIAGRGEAPTIPEQPLCDQPHCPILVHTAP
jgi:hypothetical protein